MTIFNDLSLNSKNKYPSIKIALEDGTNIQIDNVHFYSTFEINGREYVRVHTDADKPLEYEGVQYIYNTNYSY